MSALQADYARRRPLHQLLPLLIHLNFFGEEYGVAIETAALETLQRL